MPIRVFGQENIPSQGPCAITINHYTRRSFPSWWLTLSVSSVTPVPIRWVIAAGWTYPNWLYSRTISPATFWAFTRLAKVYNFFPMPPMPPRPKDLDRRAAVVRHLLAYARQDPQAVIGFAPEGGDEQNGELQQPPEGVGRLLLHLAHAGLNFIPVGIFESDERLCLRFGAAYQLSAPLGMFKNDGDHYACDIVMRHIAGLLPEALRGKWN